MTIYIRASIDDLIGLDLLKLKHDILGAVDNQKTCLQDIYIDGKRLHAEIEPDGNYMEVYL